MPRNVKSIVGYDNNKERMYFRGLEGQTVISSENGIDLDLASAAPADLIPAVSVPGETRSRIGTKPWTGQLSQYKGRAKTICKVTMAKIERAFMFFMLF